MKLNNIAQCVVQAQPKSEQKKTLLAHNTNEQTCFDYHSLLVTSVNIAYAVHICVYSLSAALLSHIPMILLCR